MENRRSAFRIKLEARATVHYRGTDYPAFVHDLSASGALVRSTANIPEDDVCRLVLDLEGTLLEAAGAPSLVIELEVLAGEPQDESTGGGILYRCRSLAQEGTAEYERSCKVVFAQQRNIRARSTGSDESSPMAIDPAWRARHRKGSGDRFSQGSVNPLLGD